MAEDTQSEAPTQGDAPSVPARLFAIKGTFTGDFSGTKGVFLVVMDVNKVKIHHLFAILANEQSDFRFNTTSSWKQLEDAIISTKLSGGIAHQMSADVQNFIKKSIKDESLSEICNALQDGNNADIRRIFEEIISKAIAEANPRVTVGTEAIAAAETPDEDEKEKEAEKKESEEEAEASAAVYSKLRIKIDPILSPVQGTPAKKLEVGTLIAVKVRENKLLAKRISQLLTVPGEDLSSGQVMATVLSVEDGEFERINVHVELAPDIFGVASCSGELRVKTIGGQSSTAASIAATTSATQGASVSTGMFVTAAVLIFLVLALMGYVVFKGGL
ncbi:MAG: hypothetical protein JKX97_04605 [Candidatus Lindowbacteria bacterium]|nr:hypothetical protein [Candidatus Lindowbacteria bacterium]